MQKFTLKVINCLCIFISINIHSDDLTSIFSISLEGELLISDVKLKNWDTNLLIESGYVLTKEQVDMGEGLINQYLKFNRGDEILFYIESIKNISYRIVIFDHSIKLNTNDSYIANGSSLSDVKNYLGDYEEIFGEETGAFLVPYKYPNISFYTECTSNKFELPEKYINLSEKEYMEQCKIEEIILVGENGVLPKAYQ